MPTLWYSGIQGEIDYLVMDLLGPSLDNLYRKNGKQAFDVRSVCCVAIQLVRPDSPYRLLRSPGPQIDRLQFMHSRGILHRCAPPRSRA
jgi:serine/threonine protein kinase